MKRNFDFKATAYYNRQIEDRYIPYLNCIGDECRNNFDTLQKITHGNGNFELACDLLFPEKYNALKDTLDWSLSRHYTTHELVNVYPNKMCCYIRFETRDAFKSLYSLFDEKEISKIFEQMLRQFTLETHTEGYGVPCFPIGCDLEKLIDNFNDGVLDGLSLTALETCPITKNSCYILKPNEDEIQCDQC